MMFSQYFGLKRMIEVYDISTASRMIINVVWQMTDIYTGTDIHAIITGTYSSNQQWINRPIERITTHLECGCVITVATGKELRGVIPIPRITPAAGCAYTHERENA
jgi:hypothetical protein